MASRQVVRAAVDAAISLWLVLGAASASGEQDEEAPESRTECRQIFSDFTDAVGARLATNLEALDQGGQSYLRWLIFRNGSHEAFCDRSAIALAADPRSRFVVVCGVQFVEIQAADPGYAAALVIHEELHVLGLGENPPSSAEITKRVIARCGR